MYMKANFCYERGKVHEKVYIIKKSEDSLLVKIIELT